MYYSTEVKEAAKRLFLRRCKAKEIQAQLNLPNIRIVYYWIRQGGWEDMLSDEEPLTAVGRRITLLLDKADSLTKDELNELDRLTTVRERLLKQAAKPLPAPIGETSGEPQEGRQRPRGERSARGDSSGKKREKKAKNDISGLTEVDFLDKFISKMYRYQQELFAAKQNPLTCRIRNILKSRQVGLTYYFAGEAFMDAVLTGDNQVFLSASRSQSEIFRSYIIQFAKQWFDIELTGNPITLSNGAELRFLSTNSSTAQGYHGHVYVDEYFWIRDFDKLSTVASAMGTHKKWRKTYFSTPSAVSHQAYPFWSGEEFRNSKRGKKAGGTWPTEASYTQGALCPDGQWRKTITLDDAIAGGCDLFDLEQLQLEYDEDKFQQLFYCKFIDSSQSAFGLKDLERCYSDLSLWEDYNPELDRPFGNSPVWLGYDPSRTRDDATCVVVAPPLEPGAKFRILEKHSWRGQSFKYQAEQVKKLTERFNVQHIGIDTTGIGYGVFDLVRDFYPRATAIHYSLETKNTLVLKAQDTIQGSRIEWDAGWTDIAQAFLTIKRGTTTSGQVTYSASRTDATGHADIAWSIMHALFNEPLNTNKRRRSRYVTSGNNAQATTQKPQINQPARQPQPMRAFTFGEPEQVLSGNIGEYLGVFLSDDGEIYKPPVSRAGLAKLLRANAHHGAIPKFKRNLLLREFIPSEGCSTQTMGRASLDYMVFGEAYFYRDTNAFGEVLEMQHLPAINMRVKVDGGFRMLLPDSKYMDFDQEEIEHVMDYDVEQNIYGVPDYLGGLQALLLNEAATLFRRRYYSNGAHAGYIFYTNDPDLTEEDEENLRAQISASKGVGNFRSMFVNIPNGKENAIQIIPVGDFQAKDELEKVKNITRNDVIAAWRMNPALAGIIPENSGGFGDIEKIDRVYTSNEIRPICQLFNQVNDTLRQDRRIAWKKPETAEKVTG